MTNRPLLFSIARHLLLASAFLVCTAGIYRHDVPAEEFRKYARQQQFAPVGQIMTIDRNNRVGSCVLIDATHVISAAYCAIRRNSNYNNKHWKSREMGVMLGDEWYRVKAVMIHPDYTDTSQAEGADLMVMRLERPVTTVVPALLSTGLEAIGDTASLIGWGAFGPAFPLQTPVRDIQKSGGQNIIDSFGGRLVNGLPDRIYMDLDDPRGQAPNRLGEKLSLPLEIMCTGGDSGGGAFVQRNGLWYLAGITTETWFNLTELSKNPMHLYYRCLGGWTRTVVYADWIRAQLKK